LGKLQILKLRDDLEKKEGARFSLRQFHDDFLKQGFPPIKIARRQRFWGHVTKHSSFSCILTTRSRMSLYCETGLEHQRDERQSTQGVFPAAGLGTRFLPATKALPKEMLALVDKPLIQYGVERPLRRAGEKSSSLPAATRRKSKIT